MRLLVQLVVLGILCLLVGCAPKITVQVLSNGKLMTYVPKGTTVDWVDENFNSINVNFPYANPCGSNSTSSTCIVETGQGIYNCQGAVCEDPGLGVKPTTKPVIITDAKSKVPVAGPAKLYEVYCKDGTATADGPEVHYNDAVSFVPSTEQGFTLSGFSPSGACNPDKITNGIVCTVGVNQNVDASYNVQYAACTTPNGKGTLHVKMQ